MLDKTKILCYNKNVNSKQNILRKKEGIDYGKENDKERLFQPYS